MESIKEPLMYLGRILVKKRSMVGWVLETWKLRKKASTAKLIRTVEQKKDLYG